MIAPVDRASTCGAFEALADAQSKSRNPCIESMTAAKIVAIRRERQVCWTWTGRRIQTASRRLAVHAKAHQASAIVDCCTWHSDVSRVACRALASITTMKRKPHWTVAVPISHARHMSCQMYNPLLQRRHLVSRGPCFCDSGFVFCSLPNRYGRWSLCRWGQGFVIRGWGNDSISRD